MRLIGVAPLDSGLYVETTEGPSGAVVPTGAKIPVPSYRKPTMTHLSSAANDNERYARELQKEEKLAAAAAKAVAADEKLARSLANSPVTVAKDHLRDRAYKMSLDRPSQNKISSPSSKRDFRDMAGNRFAVFPSPTHEAVRSPTINIISPATQAKLAHLKAEAARTALLAIEYFTEYKRHAATLRKHEANLKSAPASVSAARAAQRAHRNNAVELARVHEPLLTNLERQT